MDQAVNSVADYETKCEESDSSQHKGTRHPAALWSFQPQFSRLRGDLQPQVCSWPKGPGRSLESQDGGEGGKCGEAVQLRVTLAKVTTKPEESPHLPPPSLNFPEPESAVTKWIPALLWDEA